MPTEGVEKYCLICAQVSLQPTEYYSRLPASRGGVDTVYLCDPMIATGEPSGRDAFMS